MMSDWIKAAAAEAAVADPVLSTAPAVVPGRVLDVDGDMIAYWAGGRDDTTVQTSRTVALNKIAAMQLHSGAESVVLHLTAATSTKADRFLIATVKPYQGQRKSGRKPKNWGFLREWMETYTGDAFRVKLWATREADDGLALMSSFYGGERVICTKDKDMRMLPGWHLNWDDMSMIHVPVGCFDLVHNELQYGHKWFWLQLLQGDTADNIPGVPGVLSADGGMTRCGEVKAEKLLRDAEDNAAAWSVARVLYEDYYGDEWADHITEQALLLWLRNDAAASLHNVLQIIPPHPKVLAALDKIDKRIKDAYDEAKRITGKDATRVDG